MIASSLDLLAPPEEAQEPATVALEFVFCGSILGPAATNLLSQTPDQRNALATTLQELAELNPGQETRRRWLCGQLGKNAIDINKTVFERYVTSRGDGRDLRDRRGDY